MVGLSLVTLDGGESAHDPSDSLSIGGMLREKLKALGRFTGIGWETERMGVGTTCCCWA